LDDSAHTPEVSAVKPSNEAIREKLKEQ